MLESLLNKELLRISGVGLELFGSFVTVKFVLIQIGSRVDFCLGCEFISGGGFYLLLGLN